MTTGRTAINDQYEIKLSVVVVKDDLLLAWLERISAEARDAGLTEEEITAELALYNSERRT